MLAAAEPGVKLQPEPAERERRHAESRNGALSYQQQLTAGGVLNPPFFFLLLHPQSLSCSRKTDRCMLVLSKYLCISICEGCACVRVAVPLLVPVTDEYQ